MKSNDSLQLSLQIRDLIKTDLSHSFVSYLPVNFSDDSSNNNIRERIFTPSNIILTMLLSAVQEDKSMQQGLNTFKTVFEHRCKEAIAAESEFLRESQFKDSQLGKQLGRPKKYLSRLPKSYLQPLSDSTAAYATARKKLNTSLFKSVYDYSTDFGVLDKELWHGMKTFYLFTITGYGRYNMPLFKMS